MSAWKGKYVIGLSGNIATGKSTVRKMLEHLGAYGIDADALAHRAIAKGAPGYQKVVNTFGKWILQDNGEINRAKLGKIVFSDPEALKDLEAIIHPLVDQAIDILVRRSKQPVVVIEAIKLLETDLASKCDAIWIVHSPRDVQLMRLMEKRGLTKEEAKQRIDAQFAQEQKLEAADVIINNNGNFESTWNQVYSEWQRIVSRLKLTEKKETKAKANEIKVTRARPKQSAEIAQLITILGPSENNPTADDIMAAFAEKAYLLATYNSKTIGIAGWKVENLVSTVDDVYLDDSIPVQKIMLSLLDEVEKASIELQCEVSLLFLPKGNPQVIKLLKAIGYEEKTLEEIRISAWREAAKALYDPKKILLLKKLREDRVLQPV